MKRKRCNIHPAPVPCHPRLVRQQGICRVIRDRPQRSECVGEVMFRPALFEIVFHRPITNSLDVFFPVISPVRFDALELAVTAAVPQVSQAKRQAAAHMIR